MIGFGLNIANRVMGGGVDAQAQAHYNRVIADGGVVPAGLNGVNGFFTAVKTIYGTSDITTAVSVGLDAQYLGYKLGAGAGATSGQAAQKLYSCAGSSGDVVQTTAASQPLLLNHSGQNYWWSNGSLNGVVSAPNISIPTSSGMSIEANVSFTTNDDLVNTSNWICSNDNGAGSRNMFLGFISTRTLVLYWANLSRVAMATAQIPAAFNGWVKATLETSEGNMLAKFFTSLDGITYTQLGATITNSGGANTFQTNPAEFWVAGNGGSNSISGKIFRAIYKDANGVTRSDFNPATYNASTSQTQWTSTTGEVWTINTGSAATGYKGALVDRTIVQADGVDDNMTGTMSAALISTFNNNNNGVNLVAKRYISSNNQFIATFGGDYTSNNSAQIWLGGGGTFLNTTRTGSAFESGATTGTYTIPNYIIYSENIIYGGTSSLRLNSTTNTTGAINGTTNKPVIVSGNIALFNSGFGKLNGLLNTLIVTSDGAKFVEIGNFMKQINNM